MLFETEAEKFRIAKCDICLFENGRKIPNSCTVADKWTLFGPSILGATRNFLETFCCDFKKEMNDFDPIIDVTHSLLEDKGSIYESKFFDLDLNFGYEKLDGKKEG